MGTDSKSGRASGAERPGDEPAKRGKPRCSWNDGKAPCVLPAFAVVVFLGQTHVDLLCPPHFVEAAQAVGEELMLAFGEARL